MKKRARITVNGCAFNNMEEVQGFSWPCDTEKFHVVVEIEEGIYNSFTLNEEELFGEEFAKWVNQYEN